MAWRSQASSKPLLILGVEEFTELLLETRTSFVADIGPLEFTGNKILLFARVDDLTKDGSGGTMIILPCGGTPFETFLCPHSPHIRWALPLLLRLLLLE